MIIKSELRKWRMKNRNVKKDQQVNWMSLSSILPIIISFFVFVCHNFVPDLSQCNTIHKLLCFFNCVTGWKFCVISGFCHEVNENCSLLGFYTVSNGNSLLTFQDNLFIPSEGSRTEYLDSWPLKNGLIGCPKTSVRNFYYSLHSSPEEHGSLVENSGFHHCNPHPPHPPTAAT